MKSFGRLSRSNTVFFSSDIQTKIITHIYQNQTVIDAAKALSKFSKLFDIPVVITEHEKRAFGGTVDEIMENVNKENIFFGEKTHFSMCIPEVLDYLNSKPHLKNVVLYGIETHICLQQTALDLLERGFDVHVLTDAVSSIHEINRSTALQFLQTKGAHLSTVESIMFEIMKNAKIPEFKEVLKIVKDNKERNLTKL